MEPGSVTQHRHWLAAAAARFPHVARLAMFLRWVYWFGYGWPLAATSLALVWLVVFGIPAIQVWQAVPFSAVVDGVARVWGAVPKNRAGACLVGAAAAGVVYRRRAVGRGVRAVTGNVARAFVVVAAYLSAWWTIPVPVMAGIHVAVPVLWVADIRLGAVMDAWWVRRQYAGFRRDFPAVFAILAAKSPKIQSFDTSVEDTVADVASNRPLLEAPALWPIAQFDGHTVTVRAFRTPGRGLGELLDVLDEISAQYPSVADAENSIELIWPDRSGSNFATSAFMRIHFKPRAGRDGGGGGWRQPFRWFARFGATRTGPAAGPVGGGAGSGPVAPLDPAWPENPAAEHRKAS